jgi:peptidyl-prolyl cis-trans isomerase B (cyclophilin B)
VSGKQSKKERKAQREAQREALRKAERQRTIFTMIVIGVVVAIGGVLIWVSLEDPVDDELADLLDELATEEPEDVALDDQAVACGGEVPPGAEEDREMYDAPEQVLEDGLDYQAVIETSCGQIILDLDQEGAPEAVNSFVFLAQEGFFDGLRIFRNATSIDALQTGSGTNDASWQIGYQLTDELESAEEEGYPAGTVAMANSGPDTAGSQFFFVYGDGFQAGVEAGALGPTYTRFGMVVEGLSVLEVIGDIPTAGPAGETPTERIYIESVTITPAGAVEPAAPADDGAATDDAAADDATADDATADDATADEPAPEATE